LRWEVTAVDIGGIVDHHSMSWGERWLLLILVELLNITQSVEVRGDFVEYQQQSPLTSTHWVMVNNSTNIKKITSHLNSLSDDQQFHQYQQKSPLTSTHWEMVNNSTTSIEVRGDFCWYWWNYWPSLNEFRWEVIFVNFVGFVDPHSMMWWGRWCLLLLLLVPVLLI
jgi:hypothetical protein